MSKRAEQKALEAYPENTVIVYGPYPTIEPSQIDDNKCYRIGFINGYVQAEKDFIALIKQYIKKGERCMEQGGESQIYAFWDGFHNCAENILRELEEEHESD